MIAAAILALLLVVGGPVAYLFLLGDATSRATGLPAFVWAALPEAPRADRLDVAPDFSLPATSGETVSLAAARAEGPVLLVFFRGAW